jgi:phenylalanyl-tRNA synthetase beta chain
MCACSTNSSAGSQLGEGKKSISPSPCACNRPKTLTDAEIEAVTSRVVDRVANATGGVLRG